MRRFLLIALAVAALVCAAGIIRVDIVHERRLAAGEPMTFTGWLKEMNGYVPPTDYARLWPERR